MEWLENRAYWLGEINRADLMYRFGVSLPQASADLALYQEMAPGNLSYDSKGRVYRRAEAFKPLFEKDERDWLTSNSREDEGLRSLGMVSVRPDNAVGLPSVISALAQSFRTRTPVSVLYQSFKDPEPRRTTICPHNIVETALRPHVRAWDATKARFVDMVTSRILQADPSDDETWVPVEADVQWNTMVNIVLIPSSKLTENQRSITEAIHCMADGRKCVEVRECLAYYYLSSLYLVDAVRYQQGDPKDHNVGLAVENWEELQYIVMGGSRDASPERRP